MATRISVDLRIIRSLRLSRVAPIHCSSTMLSWFFRPPFRASDGSTASTLSTAAVTLLGLRVTRDQILRIAALLTLRTLVNLIDIPLDDSVQTYLWSILFSSVQAGVAVATIASVFRLGGFLGRLISNVIPPAADAAFLKLFAALVVIAGPIVAVAETAVVVYYIMRLSRRVEAAMFRAEASGVKVARAIVLSSVFAIFWSALAGIYLLWSAVIPNAYIIGFIATCIALLVLNVFLAEDGNIVEASFLALYIVAIASVGMVEEATVGAPLLGSEWLQTYRGFLCGDDVRAVTLVLTFILLLLSMSRAAQFFRVLMYGYDAVYATTGSVASAVDDKQKESSPQRQTTDHDDGIQAASIIRNDAPAHLATPSDSARTLVSTMTLLAATFRILLWARAVNVGEYLPLPCRAWQIASVTALYAIFVRM